MCGLLDGGLGELGLIDLGYLDWHFGGTSRARTHPTLGKARSRTRQTLSSLSLRQSCLSRRLQFCRRLFQRRSIRKKPAPSYLGFKPLECGDSYETAGRMLLHDKQTQSLPQRGNFPMMIKLSTVVDVLIELMIISTR